jgi:hypothetical protein
MSCKITFASIEHLERSLHLSVAVVLSVRIARSVQSIRQEYSHDRADDATASTQIEDMTIRNMLPSTQKALRSHVRMLRISRLSYMPSLVHLRSDRPI